MYPPPRIRVLTRYATLVGSLNVRTKQPLKSKQGSCDSSRVTDVLLTCCQRVFNALEARLLRQLHFRRSGGLAQFCFPVVDLICATLNPIQVGLQRLAALQNLRREVVESHVLSLRSSLS
jgi:hypothetical protein